MKRCLLGTLSLLFSFSSTCLSAATELPSLLLTQRRLSEAELAPLLDRALGAKVVTIVEKVQPSPSGDPRDYISYARYWWPDPNKPGGLPFIRRDGAHNREQVDAGDRAKIDRLVDNVTVLGLGWAQGRREECARRAGEWLRAWFVTPETRMHPNLDHAQVRLGHDGNRGSASGVIDTRAFAELVAAVRLLEDSPALAPEERAAVQRWFDEFFTWLTTAPLALAERRTNNNHATWYFVQTVALARYRGRDDEARVLAREARGRIAFHFAKDGRQPEEIGRVDGLGYSAFNLEAWIALARLARPLGVELWHYTAADGASLKRGVDFLRPYNAAPRSWPHRQMERLEPGFLDRVFAAAAELEGGAVPRK